MRHRLHRQAQLLDTYWTRLRTGGRRATPPDGLDPDMAALAERLAATRDELGPTDTFRTALRHRLQAQARVTQNQHRHAWTGPAINRETPRHLAQRDTPTPDQQTSMPRPASTTHDPHDRRRPHRRASEVLVLVASVLLFILVGVMLTLLFQDDDDQAAAPVVTPEVVTSNTATPAPTSAMATATVVTTTVATPTATAPSIAAVVATIPLDDYGFSTNQIAIGAGAVWIPVAATGEILRIDPATNEIVARVTVSTGERSSGNPDALSSPLSSGLGITIVDGAVWVVSESEGALKRIDPATNQVVTTIPLGVHPRTYSLPVGEGTLWVVSEQDQQVLRVDLASEQVVGIIEIPGTPQDVTVAFGAAWVTDRNTDEVWKIDPATNQVHAAVALGGADVMASCPCPRASQIVASEESLWVLRRGGDQIVRIDPRTNEVIATLAVPGLANDLMVDGNHLWVTTGTGFLVRIDLDTNQIVSSRPLTNLTAGLDGVAVGEEAIWITAYEAVKNIQTGQTTIIQGWTIRLQPAP